MRMRQPIEESLVMLQEELKEEIEVYDSFFRLNTMKPEDATRWKEMLEEHRFMKNLYVDIRKQIEKLDQL
jgi:hypothetical protein